MTLIPIITRGGSIENAAVAIVDYVRKLFKTYRETIGFENITSYDALKPLLFEINDEGTIYLKDIDNIYSKSIIDFHDKICRVLKLQAFT